MKAHNYGLRSIAWVVGPEKEPLFSETMTTIRIEDEAAGEFVIVEQQPGCGNYGKIAINPEEWPALRAAIDHAIAQCREGVT